MIESVIELLEKLQEERELNEVEQQVFITGGLMAVAEWRKTMESFES